MDHIQSFGKVPKDIIDPNIFSDYAAGGLSPKKIKNLLSIKPDIAQQQALMEIMEGKEMTIRLTLSYSISQYFTIEDFAQRAYGAYLYCFTLDILPLKVINESL